MAHAYLVPVGEEPLYGLSPEFTGLFTTDVLNAKRQAVTDEALGYMAPAVVPPLTAWGSDIKQKVADLLMYELKSWLGLAPQEAAVGDENIILRAQAARDWLKSVGLGQVTPQDVEDASQSGGAGMYADIDSDCRRGW